MIHLLDNGFVRLVDSMGNDLSVVRAARVSHAADWRTGEDAGKDEKLIQYLWQHEHTSPFESVVFTFEVKAPIFVFRQWQRHRTWSFSELSGRYAELRDDFFIPDPEMVGRQSEKNKQARIIASDSEVNTDIVREHCIAAFNLYHQLLDDGWPRELARIVLPLNTYSRMFGTVSLLNLFKFLTLRIGDDAQYEIRVYAEAMLELIRPIVPVCVSAWEMDNDFSVKTKK